MEGILASEAVTMETYLMETGALGTTTQAVMWKGASFAREAPGGPSISATRSVETASILSIMIATMEITRMEMVAIHSVRLKEDGGAPMEPLGELMIVGNTLLSS